MIDSSIVSPNLADPPILEGASLSLGYDAPLRHAHGGNVDAQGKLGFMLEFGHSGANQNITEAIKWYLAAAQAGHALSQHNLSIIYRDGRGVAQNYDESLRW